MRASGPSHSPLLPLCIDLLACPACLGKLRLQAEQIVCVACTRRYPIVDGLAVLLIERAEIAGEVAQ